jgi:hypothetical protein
MRARGADVLGVELNIGMAEIAIRRGVPTEVSPFESWDPAGRMFDRVTCAQAWHWLDPKPTMDKVVSVMRSGGRLCVFWNVGSYPDDLTDEMLKTYERVLGPDSPMVIGYAANHRGDPTADFRAVSDTMREHDGLAEPVTKTFPWTRTYPKDEWIDELSTHSDHIALEPPVREVLFDAIGRTFDRYGGSFVMEYTALLISASRL